MKNDITRDTFDPAHHFARVLFQQGRVQLDADWNEQTSILLHYLQTLAADLIGPEGGPPDVMDAAGNVLETRCGFKISVENGEILIGAGRYYVGGVLCENSAPLPFAMQSHAPDAALKDGRYLVYLDVWERLITSLDDDTIRETALGGADTAARSQIVTQVKTLPLDAAIGATRSELRAAWEEAKKALQPERRGQLKAQIKAPNPADEGPCLPWPEKGYRGMENQLYRVEIHRGGPAKSGVLENIDRVAPDRNLGGAPVFATFKWSRDNGSVVARWQGQEGSQLEIGGSPDQGQGLEGAEWVELSYDQSELRGEPGVLVKPTDFQPGSLTIATPEKMPQLNEIDDDAAHPQHPKIRRWDQRATPNQPLSEGAVPVVEGQWLDLENGIQIRFNSPIPGANQYRSGDYWLLPARASTGELEWPFTIDAQGQTVAQEKEPRGIEHHYALLAVISVAAGVTTLQEDLRRNFKTQALD